MGRHTFIMSVASPDRTHCKHSEGSPQHRPEPVNPVVIKIPADNGGTKAPRRIHAATRDWYANRQARRFDKRHKHRGQRRVLVEGGASSNIEDE